MSDHLVLPTWFAGPVLPTLSGLGLFEIGFAGPPLLSDAPTVPAQVVTLFLLPPPVEDEVEDSESCSPNSETV